VQFEEDLVIDPESRAELEAACFEPRVVRVAGPHYAIEVRPQECAAALRAHLTPLFS